MVSANEADFNLRETPPLPHNILHSPAWNTGLIWGSEREPQHCPFCGPSEVCYRPLQTKRKSEVNLVTLWPFGKPRRADGLYANRHLNGLVEFIFVNVGGLHGELSSPAMKRVSVGGVIGLGARESRVHGEGAGQSNTRVMATSLHSEADEG